MGTSGALARIVGRKRKQQFQSGSHALKQDSEMTQDDLFHHIGASVIQDLLNKNTKTSIKKLRKLGLLKTVGSVEELKSSFQKYLMEDGAGPLFEGQTDDPEDVNIEIPVEPATKAYESLVTSLIQSHNELGAGVEEESHKEMNEHGKMKGDTGGRRIAKNKILKRKEQGEKHDKIDTDGEPCVGFREDLVRQHHGFRDHIERPVDQIDEESIIKDRKDFLTVVEEPFQCWKSNGASLEVSCHANIPLGISTNISDYGIRQRLSSRWKSVYAKEDEKRLFGDFRSKNQAVLLGMLGSYMDIVFPLHKYPNRTEETAKDDVTDATLVHIINHIANSADIIKKNNDKRDKQKDGDETIPSQDQGFVRPKVLIMAPYRHHAKCIIERLLDLAIQETRTDTIKNKTRFQEEFGIDRDEDTMTEREKMALSLKPKQHRALFDGNCDDHFRIGIKVTRGSIRLYTDFYDSDILVASPLALSTKLEEAPKDEPNPVDFLSSIEIAVLHRADVMLMQNWQHVIKVFDSLNTIPQEQHDTDIMRIRDWYIAGKAGFYRQNIICSSFESPDVRSLISRYCSNHSGIARWKVHHRGILPSIAPSLKHIYERFDSEKPHSGETKASTCVVSPKDDIDARFEYFKSNLWPKIREASHLGGQLLYIPSYFDFIKVRNYLRKEAASFVALSEYSDPKDMARARAYFADKRRRVLIYTERAQFYNRHRIRGIKDIYFYQLPEHPQFYAELGNFVEESTSAEGGSTTSTVHVIFGRFDILRLERIVGTARAKKMLGIAQNRDTFIFC